MSTRAGKRISHKALDHDLEVQAQTREPDVTTPPLCLYIFRTAARVNTGF